MPERKRCSEPCRCCGITYAPAAPVPAAAGVQVQPQLSGAERFQALLVGAGVVAEPRVLSTIAESAVLSTQATMCTTPDVAVTVYELAAHVLRTRTKARVRREKNIVINGLMLVEGVQSALFFHAFESTVPRVLKVPLAQGRAAAECALWQELPSAARASAALVPVTYLELVGLHEAAPGSSATALREGILMPHYACTLAQVPAPMDARWALATARRLAAALDTLHAHGWLHGDVKPANIFIDAHTGNAWLGDYGSSVRRADIGTYSGGTPAFQCADVTVAAAPTFLDRAGLAISILSALGMLGAERVPTGWPLAALRAAVSRTAQELSADDVLVTLQQFLSSLLEAPFALVH